MSVEIYILFRGPVVTVIVW